MHQSVRDQLWEWTLAACGGRQRAGATQRAGRIMGVLQLEWAVTLARTRVAYLRAALDSLDRWERARQPVAEGQLGRPQRESQVGVIMRSDSALAWCESRIRTGGLG